MKFKPKTNLPKLIRELKDLTLRYARQQTLEPLKGVFRYVGFGFLGSVSIGLGLVLWAVGLLRVLQEETGSAFTGHLTWVPYLIMMFCCLLVASLAFYAIGAERKVTRGTHIREKGTNG